MENTTAVSTATLNAYDPSTIQGAIIWGVVAGVLTSAFLLILGQLIQKVIVPWYQGIIFKGVDLAGKWVASKTFADGITYSYSMMIRQNAHTLNGAMNIAKNNSIPGPPGGHLGDYNQGFTLTGTTWEGFVMLNLTSDDRRSLSFSTSLLQIRNRGQSLVGHMAYRSSRVDQVDSEEIVWTRI
ncbi:hypothetical protein [Nitrospirillum iridis]|uniref:Uncharacterized protein n=1 Tax=Nitrospirillum iridis TaxID=765888 RepID=A0A7X0EFV1_9PROT|nr:hypothetical protein [Nitrospirillum iridis]MBB6254340.1 hypothetical protein [Nitrospirillum iridis]